MKIQCACGAKYVLDLTPGTQSVQFVCPACGRDYSSYLNEMIRSQQAQSASAAAPVAPAPAAPPIVPPVPPRPPVAPAPVPTSRISIPPKAAPVAIATPPPVPQQHLPPAVPTESRLKIGRPQTAAASDAEGQPAAKQCLRHHQPATSECFVCKKPICPKCLELFGYFCSPLCKGKAEAQNMNVPVYAGQKFEVEKKYWRKVGLISGSIAALILAFFGLWFWYAWFVSVPHTYFSLRFDNAPSQSGESRLVGEDQIVFLHGSTLARYDMKTKKQIWSDELITQQEVDELTKQAREERDEQYRKYGEAWQPPTSDDIRHGLEASLSLHGSGKNIWISKEDKLVHYDYDTGNAAQEISLTNTFGEFEEHTDEFLVFEHTPVGAQFVTHINMATGEKRTEEYHELGGVTFAQNTAAKNSDIGSPRKSSGGLPLDPNGDPSKPIDPQKAAAEMSHLTPAGRAALPALLAGAQHNRAINAEINSEQPGAPNASPGAKAKAAQTQRSLEEFALVPGPNGYVQFASRVVKENMVERNAMKEAPKKKVLDSGNVNMATEMQAVNETLNDMQRDSGGGTVTEDLSTYRATIRLPDGSAPDWTGEVIGEPHLHPLATVNVLTAGKTVMVFDHSNKLLWKAELTYPVPAGVEHEFSKAKFSNGDGPCVEHGSVLYIFDQAVLTAFDLTSGNAKWRLPSVGIQGLFFDDASNVLVNTTSASPDDIKYAKQIDVTKKTDAIVLKIDPNTGKILWGCNPGGFVCYVSGKYLYTMQSYDRSDDEGGAAGIHLPSYFRLARINPKNGRLMWEHQQERAPVDVQIDKNTIQLLFRKELQVLRYFSF